MRERALLRGRAAAAAAGITVLAASLRALWQARDHALLGLDSFPLVLATRVDSAGALLRSLARPLFGQWWPAPYYRPVLQLSIALDHAIHGIEPFGYHATSVAVFALAALALYVVARTLGTGPPGALVALLLLCAHPVLGVVLPSPARRADTLCLLFTLLAVAAQVRVASREDSRRWLPAALAALAIGSKETGLAAPVICGFAAVLFDAAPHGRRTRHVARMLLPHAVVVALALAARVAVLGSVSGGRPVLTDGLVGSTFAMLGRLLVQGFSARAVWPDAPLPAAALCAVVLLGAAGAVLCSAEARAAMARALARPAALALATLATFAAGYAAGGALQPWYLLLPVAACAWLAGAIADALLLVLRDARQRPLARLVSAGACLSVLLLILQLALRSPLVRGDEPWDRASARMTRYLGALETALARAGPGDRIDFSAPPAFVGGRPRMAGVVVLAPYTVQAWARLAFPALRVRVAAAGDPTEPAPGEVLVVLDGGRGRTPAPRAAQAPPRAGRPDVVLILADDLGYADLGFQGSHEIATPELDRLAREGVRFTDAYVSSPICAPTRAGLLTGRDANRYGYTRTTGSFQDQMRGDIGVPVQERLLSEVLHDAGYETAAVGKWHLGVRPKYRPLRRGFDSFFGILAGSHDYFDWGGGLFGPVYRGDAPAHGSGYLTDAFADEASAFVRRPHDRPFLLYVAFHAVHGPFEAPPRYLERYAGLSPPQRRLVAAMTTALDAGVGRILDALAKSGRERNTIVIFLNDNGGLSLVSSNAPLRGGKGSLFEGGIRVPLLMRWPARLAPGVARSAVSSLDVFPTLLAAAGIEPPPDRPLDGVSLLPYLRDPNGAAPHAALTWRYGSREAIRRGSWKLLRGPDVAALGGRALFDLERDVGETHDLDEQRPDLTASLEAQLDAWTAGLPPPSEVPEGP